MIDTLVTKTCTPCRGGIPPLTSREAENFHVQFHSGKYGTRPGASSGPSDFVTLPVHSFNKWPSSPKPKVLQSSSYHHPDN